MVKAFMSTLFFYCCVAIFITKAVDSLRVCVIGAGIDAISIIDLSDFET